MEDLSDALKCAQDEYETYIEQATSAYHSRSAQLRDYLLQIE
jgi:hypothetical protein